MKAHGKTNRKTSMKFIFRKTKSFIRNSRKLLFPLSGITFDKQFEEDLKNLFNETLTVDEQAELNEKNKSTHPLLNSYREHLSLDENGKLPEGGIMKYLSTLSELHII